MQETALKQMGQNEFSIILEMIKTLLERGAISRTEADKTAQRIASEHELSLIYLW